jgi:hypothetical protein
VKSNQSISQLFNDVDELICGYKLNPIIQILLLLVEYKLDALVAPKICAAALVLFLDEVALAFDADEGFVEAELPPLEEAPVSRCGTLGDVELEAGPVEADGLTDGADVGLFEAEEDAEAAEDDVFAKIWGDEGYFEGC